MSGLARRAGVMQAALQRPAVIFPVVIAIAVIAALLAVLAADTFIHAYAGWCQYVISGGTQ